METIVLGWVCESSEVFVIESGSVEASRRLVGSNVCVASPSC